MKLNVKLLGIILLALIIGWGASYLYHTKTVKIEDKYAQAEQSSNVDKIETSKSQHSTEIPPYALETLEYVLEHQEAPAGYVGGRTFQNRERLLPKTNEKGESLRYQEWDVHPKERGENRGAERLVTSSDGSAYFTSDHYRSFQKIK